MNLKIHWLYIKYPLLLSISVYSICILLVLLLSLILNFSIGDMSFNKNLNGWFNIFLHNLKIDLIIILGGFFFSVLSIILIAINGFLLGGILGQGIINNEIVDLLLTILPHGIVETIGFLLSSCIAIEITIQLFFKKIWDKKFSYYLLIQLSICIIFCLISAIIEGA